MTQGTETEYVSRDDESEAERLEELNGVGETIYLEPEDVNDYNLTDFGISSRT